MGDCTITETRVIPGEAAQSSCSISRPSSLSAMFRGIETPCTGDTGGGSSDRMGRGDSMLTGGGVLNL